MIKIIKSLALTGTIYGYLGWLYVILVNFLYPQWLELPLSHITLFLRTDIFGIICFIVSALCFFVYKLIEYEED